MLPVNGISHEASSIRTWSEKITHKISDQALDGPIGVARRAIKYVQRLQCS